MADDGNKLHKVTLTNNDVGPRYAFTARGMEVVQSGASLDTEMNSAQIDGLEDELVHGTDDVERWTVERITSIDDDHNGQGDDGSAALAKLPVTKLREIAEAEGVLLTGRKDGDTVLPDLKSAKDIAAAIQAKRDAG